MAKTESIKSFKSNFLALLLESERDLLQFQLHFEVKRRVGVPESLQMMLCIAFLKMVRGRFEVSAFEEAVEFGPEKGVVFVILEDFLHAAGQKGGIIDAVLVLLGSRWKLSDAA